MGAAEHRRHRAGHPGAEHAQPAGRARRRPRRAQPLCGTRGPAGRRTRQCRRGAAAIARLPDVLAVRVCGPGGAAASAPAGGTRAGTRAVPAPPADGRVVTAWTFSRAAAVRGDRGARRGRIPPRSGPSACASSGSCS
ncbi:MAG: hypothetical protein U5K43_07515 [Halofilum sp. (in: g-proteobacteria)]|nr:hypothetical protein [Halofilum sp. (in: g-proteobacteria)]